MIEIDLETIEEKAEKVVDKDWGKEIWLVNNEKYCSKILILNKQHRCSIHYHKNKTETFIILGGLIFMEFKGENLILKHGDIIHINPGEKHRFTGLEVSLILEVSTHHEDSDSIRIVLGGKVPDEEFEELLTKFNIR